MTFAMKMVHRKQDGIVVTSEFYHEQQRHFYSYQFYAIFLKKIFFFIFRSHGPSRYTRKWEDESAYVKQAPPRNPRPEDFQNQKDFPELGSKIDRRRGSQNDREEKENKLRQNYQNDDDIRNYPIQKKSLSRQSDDRDRRDRDRRDGSPQMRRSHDRYPLGRGNQMEMDDRRRIKDKGYKSRLGRNTMEFKNQNRNKNNDYDGRGGSGGYRNNSGAHSESRNQPHYHQHDDEHVESVSFTNSKLNNNSNRYSNVDYSNVGSNMGSMQRRDYELSHQEQAMVISLNDFNCVALIIYFNLFSDNFQHRISSHNRSSVSN